MKAGRSSHRRSHRLISILLPAVAVACLAWIHPVRADDWSMFQHDAARSGCTETSDAPEECIVKWTYHQDGDRRFVHAAVVDGYVYATTFEGVVYCFVATTGDFVWSRSLEGTTWDAGPAIVNYKIYIGTSQGKLYCLRTDNGETDWIYETSGDIHGSPVVAGGMVFFGDLNNVVHCVDAATGAWIWVFDAGGPIYGAPAVDIDNRHVYVGTEGSDQGFFRWMIRMITGSSIRMNTSGSTRCIQVPHRFSSVMRL